MSSRVRVVTGLVSAGMREQLRQLALPEGSVRKLRMRHAESRLGHHPGIVLDEVEIDRARTPALRSHAAHFPLDRQQAIQQRSGLELGAQEDHLVEVAPLRYRTEGSGFLDDALRCD